MSGWRHEFDRRREEPGDKYERWTLTVTPSGGRGWIEQAVVDIETLQSSQMDDSRVAYIEAVVAGMVFRVLYETEVIRPVAETVAMLTRDLIETSFQDLISAASPEKCDECHGTGLRGGFQVPCSRGCRP